METKSENNEFSYTYSSEEQEELKKIRQKYQPQEEDKMARIRRLDVGVTRKAETVSLSMGFIGALIMGTGMSLIMTDIGNVLGLSSFIIIIIGILIGMVGMAFAVMAYPVYKSIVKKERKKVAPEIIRLTDELMK